MLGERGQPHFAHLSRAAIERPGVIDDPVVAFGFEGRSTHEYHQVIRLALAGLTEIEQIAGAERARIASERIAR